MTDKSNVMRFGHDLWQRCFAEVAAEYPSIETDHYYVDALCMRMIQAPESFDVIVTNNMFGDIITDLGAALQGGLGLAASANVNPGKVSMFEPVHGSAPDLAGTGRANPLAAVATVALMLDHLGHDAAAAAVDRGLELCLQKNVCTPDLGGDKTTSEVGDFVAAAMAEV